MAKKYLRVVDGKKVGESNKFDVLQNECDMEMEGFVIEAGHFYDIRLEMINQLKEDKILK